MLGHNSTSGLNESDFKVRPYVRSSSFKMALLFTLLLGLCAGILGYMHFYFTKSSYIKATESLIDAELNHIVALWPVAGGPRVLASLLVASDNRLEKIYALEDKNGNLFLGNVQSLPQEMELIDSSVLLFTIEDNYSMQVIPGIYAAKYHKFRDGKRLLVGLKLDKVYEQYQFLQKLSLITICLMSFVIIVSFAISTFVVSRTNRIANAAYKIVETGDLSGRINIDSAWDDMSYLASVLNLMFSRLEHLVFSVRQISDNIAHDLRTPLTRLRTNMEDFLENPKVQADEELNEKAEKLISDVDHMLATFNALLRIGRIESARGKLSFERCDIYHLLSDVVDLYDPIAEDKNIVLKFVGKSCVITCDHHLLFQAFANILDNAIKFTPDGGIVTCYLEQNKEHAIIRFTDSGCGVSDEDKQHIFNRFYRADKSRNTPGTGLGLALVAAIVRQHKGRIALEDNFPGLEIIVTLPIQQARSFEESEEQQKTKDYS